MADQHRDPHDDKVESVPLPTEDGDEVIEQENMNPEVAVGGGEWPSPATPPTGPSDRTAKRDGGPARDDEGVQFPPVKETLTVDPVAAGSGAVPDEEAAGQ